MSIEKGSRWVKDGEVVEVTNFYESVSIWCIWFIDSENNSHILTVRDFLEQYKPYEVEEIVYEFKFVQIRVGVAYVSKGFYKDRDELASKEVEFWNIYKSYPIYETKRERKPQPTSV